VKVGDERFDDDCIAADVPPGFKADPRVNRPDPTHARIEFFVERSVEDALPVRFLCGLGLCHLGFVTKESGGFRGGTRAVVEAVQGWPDQAGYQRQDPGKGRSLPLVHSHERETFRHDLVRHASASPT